MYFQENSTFFIYRAEINMVLNGRDGCNSFWDSVILFLISMTLKQLKLTLVAGWRYISKLKGWSDQFTSNSYYYWAKTLCIGTNQKLVSGGGGELVYSDINETSWMKTYKICEGWFKKFLLHIIRMLLFKSLRVT